MSSPRSSITLLALLVDTVATKCQGGKGLRIDLLDDGRVRLACRCPAEGGTR